MGDVDIHREHQTGGGRHPSSEDYEPMPSQEWCDFTSAIQRAAQNLSDVASKANIYGRNNPQNQETHLTMMLGSFAALERLRRRLSS